MPHDPQALRPHPLIKAMPRWGKETAEWAAFVKDISDHGIKSPVKVTGEGVVVDGWTRVLAAKDLQFAEIPTETVDGAEAVSIILRELALRRNLSKGALAYVAFPLMTPAIKESAARRMANLRKGQQSPESALSALSGNSDTAEGLATSLGISARLMDQAGQIHKHFERQPELREKYEPLILDPEKPAGLGAVLAGIGFENAKAGRDVKGIPHRGGKPTDPGRQLELFTTAVDDLANRFEYWQAFDPAAQAAHWRHVRQTVASLPQERREALAEYYTSLAETVRKA